MLITLIEGQRARCVYQSIERDVDLFLVNHEQISVGDYVLVHVGYAIAKVLPDDALQRLALFSQLGD